MTGANAQNITFMSSGRGETATANAAINVPFSTATYPFTQAPPKGMLWVGVQKQKHSFPGGMNAVPMKWNHLGSSIAMTAWAGSMCACVSEDFSEVAPAVCVGFTIDAQQNSQQNEELP